MGLYIQESTVNATKGYRVYDGEPEESRFDTMSEVYHFCVKEYGRCTGKVYVDREGSTGPKHVGWVFVKRAKYEDVNETYLHETWITVHTAPPTVTVQHQYA